MLLILTKAFEKMSVSPKNPKVSVIIPTYNRAEYLGRSIQSVLNQTYQDFELIIVDDGSTDNTRDIVAQFHDKRLNYIRHETNLGVAAARNSGVRAARGIYLAFQDSDDEWLEQLICR
jgi:glycosyltransferase involved in cell wall biosynthesis